MQKGIGLGLVAIGLFLASCRGQIEGKSYIQPEGQPCAGGVEITDVEVLDQTVLVGRLDSATDFSKNLDLGLINVQVENSNYGMRGAVSENALGQKVWVEVNNGYLVRGPSVRLYQKFIRQRVSGVGEVDLSNKKDLPPIGLCRSGNRFFERR